MNHQSLGLALRRYEDDWPRFPARWLILYENYVMSEGDGEEEGFSVINPEEPLEKAEQL